MLKSPTAQAGFTLVELVLAMALFSFGLLVIVAGFLALLGFYQHGTATRIVQNAARTGINEITLAGRSAEWFAYNTNTVCIAGSNDKIFYLNISGPTTRELRQASWNKSTACVFPGGSSSYVTSTDVQAAALVAEQIDHFNGFNPTPCTTAPCTQLTTLRVNLRITSDYAGLDTATHTSCKPTAGPFCAITTLSTTITAGEQ